MCLQDPEAVAGGFFYIKNTLKNFKNITEKQQWLSPIFSKVADLALPVFLKQLLNRILVIDSY